MPRFKWNDPKDGRKISNYINMMCTKHPEIAKGVLRQGIGPLDSWFSSRSGNISARTKCGCMVGTTAIVVMNKYPACAKAIPALRKEYAGSDGALVLFNFIRVRQGKPVVGYLDMRQLPLKDQRLYECIDDAGVAASAEADVWWDRDREREVIDHIERSIKKKLGIK